MLTFFLILIILASALLVFIIVAQNPKGGGLSASFGGSSTSNIMGVRQTTDFLEKASWYLAIGIMALVISSNFFVPVQTTEVPDQSRMQEHIEDMPMPMPPQQQIPQQQNQQQQPAPPKENGQ